jgi:hypothetical protein
VRVVQNGRCNPSQNHHRFDGNRSQERAFPRIFCSCRFGPQRIWFLVPPGRHGTSSFCARPVRRSREPQTPETRVLKLRACEGTTGAVAVAVGHTYIRTRSRIAAHRIVSYRSSRRFIDSASSATLLLRTPTYLHSSHALSRIFKLIDCPHYAHLVLVRFLFSPSPPVGSGPAVGRKPQFEPVFLIYSDQSRHRVQPSSVFVACASFPKRQPRLLPSRLILLRPPLRVPTRPPERGKGPLGHYILR